MLLRAAEHAMLDSPSKPKAWPDLCVLYCDDKDERWQIQPGAEIDLAWFGASMDGDVTHGARASVARRQSCQPSHTRQ